MKNYIQFMLLALCAQTMFISAPSVNNEESIDTNQILACSCGKKHK